MVVLGLFDRQRVELIEGILVDMSPIGAPHSSVVTRLTELFVLALHGRATVRTQQPFAASEDSEPEPYLAIVALGDYRARHPSRALVVIEVADTSLAYDRETKGALYAAAGVPEYWIVNLADATIEVRSEPEANRYARTLTFARDATVTPAAFRDITVRVAELLA